MSEKKDQNKIINEFDNENKFIPTKSESDAIENYCENAEIYEIGFCCFCQGPCNPLSQSCGTCSREL